ncbi:hypothetical protein ACK8P5_14660 [Paenibacillus sp. EC2-1]|uniref:hypothetical protein n=1 Tax=Paenibacillus sp. EC2-1 TaxID=3388665 RepID=UPI003BEF1528
MKLKGWVLTSVIIIIAVYIAFSFWIAKDVRFILERGMSGAYDYTDYMNKSTLKSIDPVERGMTKKGYVYDSSAHKIGVSFPFHLFLTAKVYVTHKYDTKEMGFYEPVSLSLKLKKGRWYATKALIEP